MRYKTKNCQRCNKEYQGTATAKYCIVCKDVIRQERIVANNLKRKVKK